MAMRTRRSNVPSILPRIAPSTLADIPWEDVDVGEGRAVLDVVDEIVAEEGRDVLELVEDTVDKVVGGEVMGELKEDKDVGVAEEVEVVDGGGVKPPQVQTPLSPSGICMARMRRSVHG